MEACGSFPRSQRLSREKRLFEELFWEQRVSKPNVLHSQAKGVKFASRSLPPGSASGLSGQGLIRHRPSHYRLSGTPTLSRYGQTTSHHTPPGPNTSLLQTHGGAAGGQVLRYFPLRRFWA